MFPMSVPQTGTKNETVPKTKYCPKPIPENVDIQIYDDGSAICPSRTTPGRFYALRFHLIGGEHVASSCDCQSPAGCWHKRALLARLDKTAPLPEQILPPKLCPNCHARLERVYDMGCIFLECGSPKCFWTQSAPVMEAN